MDPNANLNESLALANAIIDGNDYVDAGEAERLAELVVALDDWIRKGGFLPDDWRSGQARQQ